MKAHKIFRFFLRILLAVAGARIVDQRTGRCLGKALFIPWRGKLKVIGLEESRVITHFSPAGRVTYWYQTLIFSTHPEPDFPREQNTDRHPDASA